MHLIVDCPSESAERVLVSAFDSKKRAAQAFRDAVLEGLQHRSDFSLWGRTFNPHDYATPLSPNRLAFLAHLRGLSEQRGRPGPPVVEVHGVPYLLRSPRFFTLEELASEEKDPAQSVTPLASLNLDARTPPLKRGPEALVDLSEPAFFALSNLSAFNLIWRDHEFPTCEHAYQWAQYYDHPDAWNSAGSIARQILRTNSAHAARELGESSAARRRPDWDDVKADILKDILKAKLSQHRYVRQQLLATDLRQLVDNTLPSQYPYADTAQDGPNLLGTLWMELRDALRQEMGLPLM